MYKTKVAMFVLCLISLTAVVSCGILRNSSEMSLPLKDRMDAVLTANIDTSEFNIMIKEYINKIVVAEVTAALCKTKEDFLSTLQEHKEKMTNHITNTKDIIFGQLGGLQNTLDKMKHDLHVIITKVDMEMKKEETRCAFLAGLKKDKENLPGGKSDIFDEVKFNKGGCYDGSSGKFTANENGLYVFSWTTLSGPRKDFSSKIVKNGDIAAGNVVDNDSVGDAMAGSQTVVIEMNRGDKVWVEVHDGEGKKILFSWSSLTWASIFCGFKI